MSTTENAPCPLPPSNFVRYPGNSARLQLWLKHPDTLRVFNPAGYALTFLLKQRANDVDAAALVVKSSTLGITVTDAAAGAACVDLLPADTVGLVSGRAYYLDIQADNDALGLTYTVAIGRLFMGQIVWGDTPALSRCEAPEIARYYGDSARLLLQLTHPDTLVAFDPTDSVLIFSLKARSSDADAAGLVQKLSTVGGFEILAAAAGSIAVDLLPADAASLAAGHVYEFDVQAQHVVTGAVYTVNKGRLRLERDITRETGISIATVTTPPPAPGFTNRVAMPAATADDGALGQYAADGEKLAVYVAGIGWVFFNGFQI